MPSMLTKLLLFLSSYSPLFIILAIQHRTTAFWLAAGLLICALISIVGVITYLYQMQKIASHEVITDQVLSRDGEAMSYLVAYLVPFLNINFTQINNVISISILFFVLAVLYMNSNMLHVNPLLNLIGYHIFEFKSKDGLIYPLITKRYFIAPGTVLNVVSLDNFVRMERI